MQVELKHEYKVRIFMDETISFGTLGKTGRGVTEHYNVPVRLLNARFLHNGDLIRIVVNDSFCILFRFKHKNKQTQFEVIR